MVCQDSEEKNSRDAEGNREAAVKIKFGTAKRRPSQTENSGARTGFGGAHGGTILQIHVVAAVRCRWEKVRGKTVGAKRHPQTTGASKRFQCVLAVAEQGDDETSFRIFAVADERIG